MINQFPDMFLFLLPDKNLHAQIDNTRIICLDLNSGDIMGRDFEDLVKLSSVICKSVGTDDMEAYGINISLVVNIPNQDKSGKRLTEIFLNNRMLIDGVKKNDVIGSGHRMIFKAGKNKRYDLRIEPDFGKDFKPTTKYIINQNVHYIENKIPKSSELLKEINNERVSIYERLNNLFKNNK